MSRKFSISAGVETLFIGRKRIHLSETASTNNYAAEILRQDGTSEGTVVTAGYQTEGRGQRSRHWQSARGENLLCTFVLKPTWLAVADQFLLNKAIALAVRDTAEAFCPGSFIRIKWPNDILLEGKKLSGILVENTLQSRQIVSTLAGIGFNVNQTTFAPDAGNPVSLKVELEVDIQIDHVLSTLSAFLESWYLKLKAGGIEKIEQSYDAALWQLNEWKEYGLDGSPQTLKIKGCNKMGLLILETLTGEEITKEHGTLTWI